jgi:hypothetical protein
LEYYEIDGKQYGFERIVDKDNNKIKTNIYLNGKLTEEVVVDLANEIITSNGKEVGFIKEVLEEVPTSKPNNLITRVSEPNNMITSIVDPGGGGTKTYIRTYANGFREVTRQVVIAVFTFVDGNLNLQLPNNTY